MHKNTENDMETWVIWWLSGSGARSVSSYLKRRVTCNLLMAGAIAQSEPC